MNVPVRLVTMFLWIGVLVMLLASIHADPIKLRKERFWYRAILASWVIHMLFFYGVTVCTNPSPGLFTTWSNALRIHGGIALLLKEVLAYLRNRMGA